MSNAGRQSGRRLHGALFVTVLAALVVLALDSIIRLNGSSDAGVGLTPVSDGGVRWGEPCGPWTSADLIGEQGVDGGSRGGSLLSSFMGYWTNNGNYMSRVHCLQTADGTPDWPWIITIVVLLTAVLGAYVRIFWFWRRAYRGERPEDRNTKMMELAQIFLWCAVCGYGMSIVIFAWPGYRLLAVLLLLLNVWSWKFVFSIDDFAIALRAKRLDRELQESLERKQAELEMLVAERTTEAEAARREAESARAAADRASMAKSDFLANMSHEIRTPMTAILGYTELLLDEEGISPDARVHVDTIQRNGTHLIAVINDILDLSKIEAGRLELEQLSVDAAALLAETNDLLRHRAEAKGLYLVFGWETAPPEALLLDPTRLRQVVINLVGNAIKFTETGGVRVTASYADGLLRLRVEDTGVGMDCEQIGTLFDPFTQADSSTTRRFGGTGLGLSISRRLTRLMGGDIEVESVSGQGSAFTATIVSSPSVLAEQSRRSEPVRLNKPLLGHRVLVVDDGPDNRRLISFYLRRAGATVELAEDGQEALRMIDAATERLAFGAVVMDMQMPVMDGYSATRALRARGSSVPVIALTAHAMRSDRDKCLEAGCDLYLTKPFKPTDLIDAVMDSVAGVSGPRKAA